MNCRECKHHSFSPEPDLPEVEELSAECKFDIEDSAYMESLMDAFEDQGETGDMDRFLGERCKHYEGRA